MRIIVTKNYDEMSKKAASMVVSQITLKPYSIVGLATGDTPLGMYREIINSFDKNEVDFSLVTTFNLDEYYGLDKYNEQSYYYYMMENFFKHINVNKENINLPNGVAKDVKGECRRYEDKIRHLGGIDIQVLGIGGNGHIGFNEPNVNFEAETHLVELDKDTIEANSRFFKSIDEVPTTAISMGIRTIMLSKKIVLLASGENKAEAIFKTIEGKICPDIPASILQLHTDVTVILDEAAASLLRDKRG